MQQRVFQMTILSQLVIQQLMVMKQILSPEHIGKRIQRLGLSWPYKQQIKRPTLGKGLLTSSTPFSLQQLCSSLLGLTQHQFHLMDRLLSAVLLVMTKMDKRDNEQNVLENICLTSAWMRCLTGKRIWTSYFQLIQLLGVVLRRRTGMQTNKLYALSQSSHVIQQLIIMLSPLRMPNVLLRLFIFHVDRSKSGLTAECFLMLIQEIQQLLLQ